LIEPDDKSALWKGHLGEGNLHEADIPRIPQGFRFGVMFFIAGVVPNPLDIRFQKVSGLSGEIATTPLPEGGQNAYTQRLPTGRVPQNLVLERGAVVGSLLNIEINAALTLFKFAPSNVLVMVFNASAIPVMAWLFTRAFPVKWATSDLDANNRGILIDTIEFAYQRMLPMRI
jgi:phage tail-like protein